MRIISPKSNYRATMRSVWHQDFFGKKIRIAWSQSRAGIAIFASGQMIGPSFTTKTKAVQFLKECGIAIDAKSNQAYSLP